MKLTPEQRVALRDGREAAWESEAEFPKPADHELAMYWQAGFDEVNEDFLEYYADY